MTDEAGPLDEERSVLPEPDIEVRNMADEVVYHGDARERLAARVHGEPPTPEQYLRDGLAEARRELEALRQQRESINETVRELVAQVDVLKRAVHVFDRAAARDDDA